MEHDKEENEEEKPQKLAFSPASHFQKLTADSISRITRLIEEEKALKQQEEEGEGKKKQTDKDEDEDNTPKPDPALEAGKSLPNKFRNFPKNLYGIPVEDFDPFYNNKYTFVVVGKDQTIFRFSAMKAFFFMNPLHPLRRICLRILTHPFFSLFVMVVILVNCVFMALNKEIPAVEMTFLVIYSIEGLIKMLARGFIMEGFTYLRDPWNWLDFFVVVSAYVTSSFKSLGNASALRTFRVLRTLKTVAVVPGLKTIVGALMEAVKRLRDVMILSLFVLSIFALIGLQLYSGALLKKCIKMPNMTNIQEIFEKDQVFKKEWLNNQSHWLMTADGSTPLLCGGGICPDGYSCYHAGENPDKGFTNFDNFGWAMLCAFRLMTQDLWENLHQQVIRATGRGSVFFFVIVIFFGSFYLVNVILAIVAMAYDDCRKQDILDAEEAEAEQAQWDNVQREDEERLALETLIEAESDQEAGGIREVKSPFQNFISKDAFSENNYGADKISIKSESVVDSTSRTSDWKDKKKSMSLPETPTTSSVVMPSMLNAHMRSSQFSWLKTDPKSTPLQGQTFLLHPCLYNLDLPFADDSTAVTPSSDFLLSQLECHFMTSESGIDNSFNRYNSFLRRRCSPTTKSSSKKISEPTHFHYRKAKSAMNNQVEQMLTDIDRKLSQSDNNSVVPWTKQKHDYFAGNPFVLHSPSASLDMKDVLILKNLLKSASGKKKKGFFTLEKGETKKDFLKRKLFQILFDWECHPTWYRFAHIVELFIMDAFVDLFITICIVINTIFMAVEHADMNFTLETTLRIGNYVFTGIFGVEALLKVMALGLYKYLQDKWSCFDFIIVILSLVELGLSNVKGLSILRSFRLLRVFKLAKSWPTLNLLIGIIGRTLGALGNLCFVLAIIVFIFAVVGMQLFGPNYNNGIFENEEEMRWHFRDFFHSFMIVFRILCGEWIENMWNCIYCTGKICIVFFLLTMIIGNLVVLNLFLALLLSSFGAESLKHSQEDEATNKLQEAIDRINRFVTYIKSHSMYFINVTLRKKTLLNKPDTVISHYELKQSNQSLDVQKGHLIVTISPAHSDYHPDFVEMDGLGQPKLFCEGHGVDDNERSINSWDDDLLASTQSLDRDYKLPYPEYSTHCNHKPNPSHRHHMDHSGSFLSLDHYYSPDEACSFKSDQYKAKIGAEVNVVYVKYPDECCPNKCSPLWRAIHKTYLGRIWWKCRCYSYALVEHSYFETFIIIMILASSLALAVEDRNMEKKSYETFRHILKILDKVFTVIFVFEMALKMTAYGFKRYFTDAWCWLDFIIVDISLVSWGAEGAGKANMGAFRALRTLRALRPLRAVSRWEGMKVVVNALIQAIPSILNVLLVCLVFWLIFSIMGVNLFMGRFGRCLDSDGVVVNDSSLNRTFCDDPTIGHNMTWFNPKITFDNVLIGYLALFQVATFKGWMDIMYAAIDSREAGQQPRFEERYLMYLYFVLFIVFGSFFTMNLFIGVIIEQFNMQKKKMSGSLEMLMTEDQKKYYNAMKKLGSKQPKKPIPKPKLAFQMFFYKLTKNQKFDIAIMVVILLNMTSMALEYYDAPDEFENALAYVNTVFITIFTLECIMKLLGIRFHYFKEPWNIFDFIVVIISLLTMLLQRYFDKLPVSPTILRVVRVFRVGRVLRLVKSAKGIRTLLFSLAVSMPALFNIGLLLFLIMFIYAIVGMSCFMHVKRTAGIDDMFNFETFASSIIILFQICTSAGWELILAGLMNDTPPDCSSNSTDTSPNGDCGSSAMGIAYLCSYLVITFLVVVNMYIAVILENFSQATEDVQQGLTQDDFDMYYELWEKYDEKATQYIPLSQLSEFVDSLEEPLRIPNPNFYKLVQMNIPICAGDTVNCVDILDALTKNFLGTKDDEMELGDLKGPGRINYHPISSTLQRQREIFTVKIIQRTWRNFVMKKKALAGQSNSENLEGNCESPIVERKEYVEDRAQVHVEESSSNA